MKTKLISKVTRILNEEGIDHNKIVDISYKLYRVLVEEVNKRKIKQEISTTGDVAGYSTPVAFAPVNLLSPDKIKKNKKKKTKKLILGVSVVEKKHNKKEENIVRNLPIIQPKSLVNTFIPNNNRRNTSSFKLIPQKSNSSLSFKNLQQSQKNNINDGNNKKVGNMKYLNEIINSTIHPIQNIMVESNPNVFNIPGVDSSQVEQNFLSESNNYNNQFSIDHQIVDDDPYKNVR